MTAWFLPERYYSAMNTDKLITDVFEFAANMVAEDQKYLDGRSSLLLRDFLKKNPKYRMKKPPEERLEDFKNEIAKFKDNYPRQLLVDFYNHWSQKGPKDIKFLWEKQKAFEVGKRLASFHRNSITKFGKDMSMYQDGNNGPQGLNQRRSWNKD